MWTFNSNLQRSIYHSVKHLTFVITGYRNYLLTVEWVPRMLGSLIKFIYRVSPKSFCLLLRPPLSNTKSCFKILHAAAYQLQVYYYSCLSVSTHQQFKLRARDEKYTNFKNVFFQLKRNKESWNMEWRY